MEFVKVGDRIFNVQRVNQFWRVKDSLSIIFAGADKPFVLHGDAAETFWNYLSGNCVNTEQVKVVVDRSGKLGHEYLEKSGVPAERVHHMLSEAAVPENSHT